MKKVILMTLLLIYQTNIICASSSSSSVDEDLLHNVICNNKDLKIIEELLKTADPNFEDAHFGTVLSCAAKRDNPELIRMLIERGANVNQVTQYGSNALLSAVQWHNAKNVVVLLEKGADVNILHKHQDKTPLNFAIDALEYTSHESTQTVLNKILIVKLLLLKDAISYGFEDRIKKIFENITIYFFKFLHEKLFWNKDKEEYIKELEQLLSIVDVNTKDKFGNTPLMFAAKCSEKIVKILLDHGANVNDQNDEGRTALFWAWHYNIVELLVKRGSDVNTIDKKMQTKLMQVAEWNPSPITWESLQEKSKKIDFLIKNGAEVNLADEDGDTALIKATGVLNSPNVIKQLLDAGANPFIVNKKGKTFLSIIQDKKLLLYRREEFLSYIQAYQENCLQNHLVDNLIPIVQSY